MVEILFQNKQDIDYLFLHLKKQLSESLIEKKPSRLLIDIPENQSGDILNSLQTALKKLIFDLKRTDWWKYILKEEFYYFDEEEQLQIIEIAHSILNGNRENLPVQFDHSIDETRIDKALQEVLSPDATFSFDAFITFRLRFYIEKLSSYIEAAIDEYKLEQEYQMFLQYLREFLFNRKSQTDLIHVIDEGKFYFFDKNWHEIQQEELYEKIDRKLLSSHPVYVDSSTIAPLISIAPKEIRLYSDYPDQGIIKTLKNIFEEKLLLYPRKKANPKWMK